MSDLKDRHKDNRQTDWQTTNKNKYWLTGEPSHVGSGELKSR